MSGADDDDTSAGGSLGVAGTTTNNTSGTTIDHQRRHHQHDLGGKAARRRPASVAPRPAAARAVLQRVAASGGTSGSGERGLFRWRQRRHGQAAAEHPGVPRTGGGSGTAGMSGGRQLPVRRALRSGVADWQNKTYAMNDTAADTCAPGLSPARAPRAKSINSNATHKQAPWRCRGVSRASPASATVGKKHGSTANHYGPRRRLNISLRDR